MLEEQSCCVRTLFPGRRLPADRAGPGTGDTAASRLREPDAQRLQQPRAPAAARRCRRPNTPGPDSTWRVMQLGDGANEPEQSVTPSTVTDSLWRGSALTQRDKAGAAPAGLPRQIIGCGGHIM